MTSGDDELWQEIVQNYGDRPEFPVEQTLPVTPPPVADGPVLPAELVDDPTAHFVPPTPPPVPLPTGPRGLAWLGVLGVPVLTILLAVSPWTLPGWAALLLFGWFAGGFVYLVATMNRAPEDGWDDGTAL